MSELPLYTCAPPSSMFVCAGPEGVSESASPTVRPCLGPYGGPRGGGLYLMSEVPL